MDEAEWLVSDDPAEMLDYLLRADCTHAGERGRIKPPDRRLRLFACGCCRLAWHLLTDPRSRRAVEVAEAFADGEATEEELREACDAVMPAPAGTVQFAPAHLNTRTPAQGVLSSGPGYYRKDWPDGSPAAQAALLRCLAGNPWRPAVCSGGNCPSSHRAGKCPCADPTVRALATAAYDLRLPDGLLAPDRLAVLADALEDAGCEEKSLLCHLRGYSDGPGWPIGRPTGPHARGCWAVDCILGRD